ncbi:MAG TPA: 30S ribosomal protein S2 [Atribacteraceae bacterium]|nr:30S ribosomal protein S2 [Atribacteraceae bacterium]
MIVTMKQLLEAGVHFGHQTRRWNPKMKPYIFTERNNIYIIDLQKTVELTEKAYHFTKDLVREGGTVLFVGTKKQAQESIQHEAQRCGMYFVNQRWLGGMLTNFTTIRQNINKLKNFEKMKADGMMEKLPKKEVMQIQKRKARLEKHLSGIKDMEKLPECVFVVDPRRERNAVLEARRMNIPLISIVDTNCDPDEIDYVIPGNDDAIRAIRLFSLIIANAALEGKRLQSEGRDDIQTEGIAVSENEEVVVEGLEEVPFASGASEESNVLDELRGETINEFEEELLDQLPKGEAKSKTEVKEE